MSQKTTADDSIDADFDDDRSYDEIREEMITTKGVERSTLDVADDDHALSGMDSERQAPVEAVAKNVVERYDTRAAFIREYLANAHTACIRRAKVMLDEADIDVDMSDVRAVLKAAREELDYHPVIEIERNENPDAGYAFRISDNGIGIAPETAYAIRDIGLSGWHDDGTLNGQFGQGTMAGFLPVDHWGEFDMTTLSYLTDASYRARWKLTDLDKLPGGRDEYGTTFEFPYFIDEMQEVDVAEKVEEYASGMIVPVIYEHYDEDGRQDGTKSDDFTADYIEDRYADDSPVLTYEDQFGKVVWSPDDPEGWDTSCKTWCGYQPIERNDGRYGTSNNAYAMPSGFDVRVKVEDGSIVHVPEDADSSLLGTVPVSENRYEHLPDDQKEDHVIRSEVPEDAVVAPEPTDDRDRFESKHVESYMRHYAGKLEQELKDRVADVFDDLDGLEDLPDMDENDRELLLIGIEAYLTVYKRNDPERIQEEIEEVFGVDVEPILASNIGVVKSEFSGGVSTEFANAIARMKQTRLGSAQPSQADDDQVSEFAETVEEIVDDLSLAKRSRSATNVGRSSNRSDVEVWKIVEMAAPDGTVFMAKTLSCARKVALAWELHENNRVVVVDSYDKWEDTFDNWAKLKDLPTRNFEKQFDEHDFDDDFLDTWDPAHGDSGTVSSSSSLTGSYDDQRAKRRNVTVRYDTGRGKYSQVTGEDLYETFDSDDPRLTMGYNKGPFTDLILYRSTEDYSASAGAHIGSKSFGIAYAVVPDYVYDYLMDAEHVWTEDDFLDHVESKWFDFDHTFEQFRNGAEVGDMDNRDLIVKADDRMLDPIQERDMMDELLESIRENAVDQVDSVDEVRSITFMDNLDEYERQFHKNGPLDGTMSSGYQDTPTLVGTDTGIGSNGFDYGYRTSVTLYVESMFMDSVLGDLDHSAPEWGHFDPKMDDDMLVDALLTLADNDGFVSTDDEDVPDHVGDGPHQISERDYYVEQTMARFADVTEYFESRGDEDDSEGDD